MTRSPFFAVLPLPLFLALVVGCTSEGTVSVRFADGADGVVRVELYQTEQTCESIDREASFRLLGTPLVAASGGVFDGWVGNRDSSFVVVARDAQCRVVAFGCAPAEVGRDVEILLSAVTPTDCVGDDCLLCQNDTDVRDAGVSDMPDAPTCSDGILNQGEAGVDCGGPCPVFCYVPSNLSIETFQDDYALDVKLEESATFDTTICVTDGDVARRMPMNDGGAACVLIVNDFEIEDSARLTVVGTLPLIVVASGDVTIDGVVDVSAQHDLPGPAGFVGTSFSVDESGRGAGQHGESSGRSHAGGGGAGGRSRGGNGGNAVSDFAGTTVPGGRGGPAWITVEYAGEPLLGGAGGGRGGGEDGAGGAGGGAFQISARGEIRVRGLIRAVGGGGGGGGRGMVNTDWGAGGGGGAGGTVLLEAREIEVSGHISVAGGGGGAGPPGAGDRPDGEDGAVHGVAEGGISTRNGGNGAGDSEMATAGDPAMDPGSNGGGGGGGGGGGVIILRAQVYSFTPPNPLDLPIARAL